MPITLVLADGHRLILDGTENLFRSVKDFKVVARCRDGEDILKAVRKHRPDILVLGIRMPSKNGLDVLRAMNEDKLPTRVVVLTPALNEDETVEVSPLTKTDPFSLTKTNPAAAAGFSEGVAA